PGELGVTGLDVLGLPEGLLDLTRLAQQPPLLPPLGADDEPRVRGHQRQQDQGAFRNEVPLRPQRAQSVRVFDRNSLGVHGGLPLNDSLSVVMATPSRPPDWVSRSSGT